MKFAEFEIEPDAGVLRRGGERVKLQDLPFRVLVVLVTRAGMVVTRDELRAALWGAETFVDAEAGLNTAIGKLRDALGDDADAPRFIETLPKRGYRFIGAMAAPANVAPATVATVSPGPARARRRTALLAIAGASLLLFAAAAYERYRAPGAITIAVVRFHNETGVPANDRLAETLTDAVVVALAANPRYGVIGNSPVLRTERMFEDVRRIGAALQTDYVVLGQLQASGPDLVTRAHFIRVSDQTHLWAGKVDLDGASDSARAVSAAVEAGIVKGLNRK